jgi:hypothetical protein
MIWIVEYRASRWHNCFANAVVIELQHFDPSNKNTRAPVVAMKLRTGKEGCLPTKVVGIVRSVPCDDLFWSMDFHFVCNLSSAPSFVWRIRNLCLICGVYHHISQRFFAVPPHSPLPRKSRHSSYNLYHHSTERSVSCKVCGFYPRVPHHHRRHNDNHTSVMTQIFYPTIHGT